MRSVIAASVLVVSACTSNAAPGALGTGSVIIGGANDDGTGFVDWHGATVKPHIIMGPQGGQHVWVMLHTSRDFYASKMRVTVDMTDVDTGQAVKPGEMPFTRTLTDTGDLLTTDGNAITAYIKEPCVIQGHHILVHVAVSDLMGLTGSDEATIIPSWSGFCTP